MPNSFHGHRWTLEPHLRTLLSPIDTGLSRRLRTTFVDPVRGEVGITGRLSLAGDGSELLVVVHGHGGSTSSVYMHRMVAAAKRAGVSCLRMNMRGADRSGDDIYHGGLGEDIGRVLSARELANFRTIYLVGYSVGGHLTLCYATGEMDRRVVALATVCAPLDFEVGASELDKPEGAFYRRHLLRGLREMHGAAHRKRPLMADVARVERIRFLREWDDLVVAPRYGYRSAADYYAAVSVGPKLHMIEAPALVLVTEHDPMVRLSTVEPSLRAAPTLQVVKSKIGGHVGFPANVALGLGPAGPVEDQLVAWLRDRRVGGPR